MNKNLLIAIVGIAFPFLSFSQPSDSLTGAKVWLSADRSQLTGTKWTDLSFFKNDATGASPFSTPSTHSTINFNSALVFDGIDDYLQVPHSLEGLAELSVLAVFQSSDTTERGIWGTEQALSRNILLTTRRSVGPDTITDNYGKNEKLTALTSVLQNWDNTAVSSSNAFMSLGSAGKAKNYKPFQGSIAEVLVFDRALTFIERIQYETYLAIKYGTGLYEGNLVSSSEKLLWHVEQNAGYGKHIAGIGRDDFFKLNQKQSGSAYDSGLLLISVGKLEASNPANPATVNDQDFILWGDNGLPMSTKPGLGADSILSFVQRKWLVTANGNSANKLGTELYIDVNKLPKEPLGYWLVIDRSGQSNFSADNLEYIVADRIANGKVIYKNVLWDTDGSGKDNFGFARARNLLAVVRKLSNPSCTDETAGIVKIEVIAGKAPYSYKLANNSGSITREWKQTTPTSEQKDLVKGAYALTFTDDTRESLSRTFTMVMPDALEFDLGADKQLSQVEPVVLDVSDQIPDSINVSYRWENSFGFNSAETKITASESGVYRVFVIKASDGCVFTDDITVSGAEGQRITVYPTLLHKEDPYNISVSLPKASSVVVKVFNARGILVQNMEGRNRSEYQFITSLNDSGLYVVVIQTQHGMESHKLIVN